MQLKIGSGPLYHPKIRGPVTLLTKNKVVVFFYQPLEGVGITPKGEHVTFNPRWGLNRPEGSRSKKRCTMLATILATILAKTLPQN